MTGICGWIGLLDGKYSPEETLGGMARQLSRGAHDRYILDKLQSHAEASHGLAVASKYPSNAQASMDGFYAVVDGLVKWQNHDLKNLAEEKDDALALIEGYRRYGPAVLRQMEGVWSLALICPHKNECLIAIDRMGVYPLCYAMGKKGEFVFSSVTDGVKAHPDVDVSVSAQGVYNYLYHFVVPSPTTIYDQMHKLEPAQYIHFENGKLHKEFYWTMPYTDQRSGDMDQWSEKLRTQLDQSMISSLEGTDPGKVGAFLSGGLDSSSVCGLMMKHNGKGKSFTIGFDEAAYDESGFARIAADHFHTEHFEYFVTPDDVPEVQDKIAEIYDEPYGNTSAVPAYYCAKMAKEQGVEVLLAGDGGDELFAGNERYVSMKTIEKYALIPESMRKYFMEPLLSLPGMQHVPVVKKARSLARRYATPMPDRLYSYSFIFEAAQRDIFTTHSREALNRDMPLDLIRKTYHHLDDVQMLQRMMHMDLQITLADNDLRKVNRMCDLAGVEVRYPLLENNLVDFAASVPTEVLLHKNKLRYFFKYALKDFLPQEVINKQKHGFGLPFSVWVHKDKRLNEQITDHLSDFKKRDYLTDEFIDEMIKESSGPSESGGSGLGWDIAMLEMWFKKHL